MRALFALAVLGCAGDAVAPATPDTDAAVAAPEVATEVAVPSPDVEEQAPQPITVVTFNTGTGPDHDHDAEPDDGYGSEQAVLTDTWYGNGLAWKPVIADVAAFFEATPPDIVGFQEIFWPGQCPEIPAEARSGFVCEDWSEGDPTVAGVVLGEGYQVACHPGKPDKCVGVRRAFGALRGCDGDLCLEGLTGFTIEGCGGGARVARGLIDPADGSAPITVVSVHGSSGFDPQSLDCRHKQAQAVFVDLGDGEPGANGERNVILGDLNTDPGKLADAEPAAALWAEQGDGVPFRFHTEVGYDVPATYGGLFNIDHVLSDAFDGGCWAAGVTPGHPPVSDIVFFDHVPLVCTLTPRS